MLAQMKEPKMVTMTATLSQNPNDRRKAALIMNYSNGSFGGASIEIWRGYGGAFASTEFIRTALLEVAQGRATFEANIHEATLVAPVVWED